MGGPLNFGVAGTGTASGKRGAREKAGFGVKGRRGRPRGLDPTLSRETGQRVLPAGGSA